MYKKIKRAQSDEFKSNKIVSNCMEINALVTFVILICNYFDIFNFKNNSNNLYVNLFLSFAFFVALIPGLLTNILKLDGRAVKYIIITISIAIVFSVYVFFGIYSTLILFLPFFLVQIYGKRAISLYTAFVSFASIFLVQWLSKKYCLIDISQFSFDQLFLPLVFELLVLFVVGIHIFGKNNAILRKNINNNKTISIQKKLLTIIMENSHQIFASTSLFELHYSIKNGIMDVLRAYQKNDRMIFHMGLISDGFYFNLDETDEFKKVAISDDKAITKCHGFCVGVDIYSQNKEAIVILDNCIILKTYYKSKLNYFVVIEINVDKNDRALKDVLSLMQKNIEVATNNLILNFDLQTSQAEMIYAFAKVSESKSHQTGDHIKRVSEYMKILCKEAGYSKNECEKIGVAAMMHDIGKIFIPSEILEKKGKLTNEEFEIIKGHIYKGEELLENCPGDVMEYAKIMIKEHHEHYDGNGYIGLKGDDIHFLSRLIAVADVFDALISTRSYKAGWNPNEAYDLIVAESGTHFDPFAVEIFKKCFLELIFVHHKFPDTIIE